MTHEHQSHRATLLQETIYGTCWNKEERAEFSNYGQNLIIVTEDLNAQAGSLSDYAKHDSDLYLPLPPDYTVNLAIRKKIEDRMVNNFGKELYLTYVLRISNGHISQKYW